MSYLFGHYLRHYFHLAICIFCLIAFTYKASALPFHWTYAAWVALITLILYNFHHFLSYDIHQWNVICQKNVVIPGILIMVLYFGFIQIKSAYTEIPALLISFLLTTLYFRKTCINSHALRKNYLLKPLIIGVVFALLTAYIPYIHAGYSISESIWLSFARCTFVSALALTFDIGDVLDDTEAPVLTLPQKIGIMNTKWVATILLLVSGLIEACGAWVFLIEFPALIALFLTYFAAWLLMLISDLQRPDWYYLFLVDGTMALPLLFSFV